MVSLGFDNIEYNWKANGVNSINNSGEKRWVQKTEKKKHIGNEFLFMWMSVYKQWEK
jgi:hypothetical protein